MIFQELNKLKWNTVMSAVVCVTFGIFMIICPADYISTVIGALGAVLLILAVIGVLDFISSNKALIHYVYLGGWLIMSIVGSAILFFEYDSFYMISWLFGLFLMLIGCGNAVSALSFARRAGRKGWWVLFFLSVLQIVCGLIVLFHPWWNTPSELFRVVGVMILFSAVISSLRLIWSWPLMTE